MYSQHPYKTLPCLITETSIIMLLLLGICLLFTPHAPDNRPINSDVNLYNLYIYCFTLG